MKWALILIIVSSWDSQVKSITEQAVFENEEACEKIAEKLNTKFPNQRGFACIPHIESPKD